MALNTYEMWSNGIKIAFFPKKQKIEKRLGASPPTPIASGGWDSANRPPFVMRLSYTSLLNKCLCIF